MTVLIEAAVDSVESALAAQRAGAQRLELCANLGVGGTTPSEALIDAVLERVDLPIAAMVRPRGGSFVHSAAEIEQMQRDVDTILRHGVAAVVLGILDAGGHVDVAPVRELVRLAGGTPVVFHKAFDRIADRAAALETLVQLGLSRVLTSGGAPSAMEGAAEIAALHRQAAGRIEILAGGKVRGANVRELVAATGVDQVHARCGDDGAQIREIAEALS